MLEIGPYTVRHTMATELRRRGVSVWEVAGFLGHTTGYTTTERYAKFGADHLAQAVRAIDDCIVELHARAAELAGDSVPSNLRASEFRKIGGAEGDRTPDLYNAIVALSQLSYGPMTVVAAEAARDN